MAVGRISGPLLKDNLLRNGVNLAFETSLLYLDVVNSRVGVNTATPQYTLDINGTTNSLNLNVTTQATVASFTISGNTIASSNSTINLTPQGINPVVYQGIISVGNLNITGDTISNTAANDNINISPSGTGSIYLNANTLVSGNLHATGNITADGNITLGNNTSVDTVTFDAEVASNILPKVNNTYTLGSSSLTWANVYTNTVTATTLSTTNFSASGTLSVTGNSTLSGNTSIGATNANTLTVNAYINSNLVPSATATYDIGTGSLLWNTVYGNTFATTGLTINGNTVTSTGVNSNLNLIASGTGAVTIPNNTLSVANNAVITGMLSVTGNTTLTNTAITGTLTQTGNFSQTGGNFTTSGSINSGAITSSGTLTLPDITLSGTTITGTTTNTNLILTPFSGKQVEITSSATVDQNLSVTGNLAVTGTTTLAGNATIDGTLTQTGNFSQQGNFNTLGTITSGSITSTGTLTLPDMTLSGTTITGTTTNTNLILTAKSGQLVEIASPAQLDGNANIAGNLSVAGTTTLAATNITGNVSQTGNYSQTGNFTTTGDVSIGGNLSLSGVFTIPNISISGSTITTTQTNLDLYLIANGTGNVYVENLIFNGNTISSSGSDANIYLTPQATGNVVVNNNTALVIPVGTTTQRPNSPSNGMIRYNTTSSRYEGYASGYWQVLGGVTSVDGATYITAESAPGAGNNVISFYANNVNTAYIDSTKLYASTIQTSQLSISANTISALSPDTNIDFVTSGTGGVALGNILFVGNTITNTVPNAVTQFVSTGTGYVKYAGTFGVVLPSGNTNSRPALDTTEIGMARYNTDYGYVEVFNGATWSSIAGAGGVTASLAQDLGIEAALALG